MRRSAATISMIDLAHAWLEELRIVPEPAQMPVSEAVVLMNFTRPPEDQWVFIKAAVEAARSDNELVHIAAGPLEHLLGQHGPDYIDAIEILARSDAKFARTTTAVWKYMMTDDIWARVQAIQKSAPPLARD
jgi:acetoin utilization deacetylase AcuC-like enzyme